MTPAQDATALADRLEGPLSWKLHSFKHADRKMIIAALRALPLTPDEVCETCKGTREIDQRHGGAGKSGIFPCPDCSTPSASAGPQAEAVAWQDIDCDDPQVVAVANAIARDAIGRPFDDFLPLNAYDMDQGDLIDYARAAVAVFRAHPQPQQADVRPAVSIEGEPTREQIETGAIAMHSLKHDICDAWDSTDKAYQDIYRRAAKACLSALPAAKAPGDDLCPRCRKHPVDRVLLGTPDEGHICGTCWTEDRAPVDVRGAVIEALNDVAEWCMVERSKIGAVDGYDYRSGEEYGLRRAEIELTKRALSQSPATDGAAVARPKLGGAA